MKTIKTIILGIAAAAALTSCSSFLDIKPTDKITADNLFASEGGIQAFLANLYYQMPIEDFAFTPNLPANMQSGFHYNNGSVNNNGAYAWVKTDDAIGSQVADLGDDNSYKYWEQGYVLNNNVNQFFGYIESLTEASEETVRTLTGEAWFIRGMTYFALARRYGGVPIIETIGSTDDLEALKVPRATEVETWKYVIDCFDKAAEYLGDSNADRTRASKWVALAYKSRAALHAASVAKYWDQAPLSGDAVTQGLVGGFNASDRDEFYKACLDASKQVIESGVYSLYKPNPANPAEAAVNYTAMFEEPTKALEEVIFLRGYDKTGNTYGHNVDNWCNPAQTAGAWPHPGRCNPTLEFAENFESYSNPGKSSKFVTYEGDNYDYNGYSGSHKYIEFDDPLDMFADKDARLAGTVILPGSTFKGTKIVIQGGVVQTNGTAVISNATGLSTRYTGSDGKTYYPFGGSAQAFFSGFSANGGNNTRTGFSMRKFLDNDYVANGATWQQSTTDWIDMRYAEVLLNYAEAHAESGLGDATLAKECINATRHRAAHKTDIEPTLENVLRERRAELTLGNTRYWDLIRRRQFHKIFENYRRGSLTPVFDLRSLKYIFVRQYVCGTDGKPLGGATFTTKRYYKPIPGISGNGLVQNPQY